ncbi:OprO/OprP family phosphate-selective porin, partial [bacterium]|nr:OprO/OprP family phosphate-selective porin [bacterium]
MSSSDGSVKLKMGGRLQDDWVFQRGEAALEDALGTTLEDGTEFRRIRFYFAGTVGNVTEFKAQLDFVGGNVGVKDLYVGVKKIPGLGTVRVGNQYEPMGLNEMTSSKYITFIERATPMAFTASRRSGLLATNHAGPVMWSGMFWRETDGTGMASGSGEYNVTGRVAMVPLKEDDGRRLVHLGVSASHRNPAGGMVKYSAHPENHMTPSFVSTGDLAATDANVFAAEAAAVVGPFSVQGEFLTSRTTTADGSDPSFM